MNQAEAELFPQTTNSGNSDSEAEVSDESMYFSTVIDDYCDPASTGRFQRKLVTKYLDEISSPDSLNLLEWSKMYIKMEDEYDDLLKKSKSASYAINKAKYIFATVAQLFLRIGNSSSVLERAFADAVRSIANRRVQLRNDINLIFRPQGNRDRFKNLKSIGQIIRSKKIPIHFKFLNLS